MIKRICLFLLILLPLSANCLTLRSNAPAEYIVKHGDTLWEIASRYLAHPWEWTELLKGNPQIKNPNKLYPGAIIYLHRGLDAPYITVLRNGTVKLSPKARPVPLEKPIPTIPLADIKPFLNGSIVLDQNVLATAPYVVAYAGEHLIASQGNEIYVKDLEKLPPRFQSFTVYRQDGCYTNPDNKDEFLGYKALLVGYADIVKRNKPATLVMTEITRGVHIKDRVLPNDYPEYDLTFFPKAPSFIIHAKIIDVLESLGQIAKGQIAVINQGENAGLQPGYVLGIYQLGKIIKDPLNKDQLIRLPQEHIGELMIFRAFSKTSFGIVMSSTRAIRKLDTITNP